MWALHENKSLLEGQFAIVLQQISINCGPNSHPGKCQLKWITALSAALSLSASLSRTDDIRPVLLCDGDMCPNIFKCHHPGVWWECGGLQISHLIPHRANIFNTFSPCLVLSLQSLTEPGLSWGESNPFWARRTERRNCYVQTIKPDLDTDRGAD